jgi:hypothetical protein
MSHKWDLEPRRFRQIEIYTASGESFPKLRQFGVHLHDSLSPEQVRTQNFALEGADTEAVYNLCSILKSMF